MLWSQFSAKKFAFFSKTNVMIKFFNSLALFWVKNANFFAEFFGENIFKIVTSVPGKIGSWAPTYESEYDIFTYIGRPSREGEKILHRLEIGVAKFVLVKTYQNGKNVQHNLKLYQIAIKYTKWHKNIPNGYKNRYTNIFHSKALQNIPKL
jgi:hypothetical protein